MWLALSPAASDPLLKKPSPRLGFFIGCLGLLSQDWPPFQGLRDKTLARMNSCIFGITIVLSAAVTGL